MNWAWGRGGVMKWLLKKALSLNGKRTIPECPHHWKGRSPLLEAQGSYFGCHADGISRKAVAGRLEATAPCS